MILHPSPLLSLCIYLPFYTWKQSYFQVFSIMIFLTLIQYEKLLDQSCTTDDLQTKWSPPAIYCEPTMSSPVLYFKASSKNNQCYQIKKQCNAYSLFQRKKRLGLGNLSWKPHQLSNPPPLPSSSPSQCCCDDKEDKQYTRGIKKLFTSVLSVKKHLSFNCLSTLLLCTVLSILFSNTFQSTQGQVLLHLLGHGIDTETQSELI